VDDPDLEQNLTASGAAQAPVQGYGIQHNYFGNRAADAEAAVSIAPPFGQREENLPLRGRDVLLAGLTATSARVQVLHGMGGCGKTRVALEVAYQAGRRGAEVWWVSGADTTSLVTGMRAVGRRLGVTDAELDHGDAADEIWRRLSAWRHPWLLVIDGADDAQVLAGAGAHLADGRGWLRPLPPSPGTILVTTRDGSAASWGAWCCRRRLGVLPAEDAARVLADHAGHLACLGSADEAWSLAARLGGLPLALKIAGSYLAESVATPQAFAGAGLIRTYRQYQIAIEAGDLATVFPAPGGELSQDQARGLIGRTWELSLDLLDGRQLPEARRLLRLLATFADAPIPHEFLLDPATLAASPLFTGLTGARLWQALRALDGYGLIDLVPGGGEVIPVTQLHPLIRDTSAPGLDVTAGEDATAREYVRCLDLAARLLARAAEAGSPEDPRAWPLWRLLARHALYVFDELTAEFDRFDAAAAAAAADAAGKAADYFNAQGLPVVAEALYRQVRAVEDRVLGADHPETLVIQYSIAVKTAERGDHAAAEAEFREVLAGELRVLGPDHPSTLKTRHAIAWLTAMRGDHARAEAEFRAVLAAKLAVLGPDHPSTLTTRHEIARLMAERGDRPAAEAEFRAVLAAKLAVLGGGHPSALKTRHAIAWLMAERGERARAEAEFRDVLERELVVLGPDHPSTLTTRHEIARLMAERGDRAGAEAGFRAVLAARTGVLGPDHPETRASADWVGRLTFAQDGKPG